MAHTGYLFIKGIEQGDIESDLEKDDVEGAIAFYAFEYKVNVPEVNGKKSTDSLVVHNPIKITKAVDETSTQLLKALCTSEKLVDVEIRWYSFVDGYEELDYTIILNNAKIVGIDSSAEILRQNLTDQKQYPLSEMISIMFEKVSIEHKNYEEGSIDIDIANEIKESGKLYT